MLSKRYAHTFQPRIFLFLALMVILAGGISVASAQGLVQPDGRINQVHHFGGDALYCVDDLLVPTTQYSDWGEGGFLLIDEDGQHLWFVPAEVVAAAVEIAKATGNGVLVAEGRGTYGPTSIYTYVTEAGDDYFIFTGYDEYGKPNSIEFKFCLPVGPDVPDYAEDVELCILVEHVLPEYQQRQKLRKVHAPSFALGKGYLRYRTIPCDQCPADDSLTPSKRLALKPDAPSGTEAPPYVVVEQWCENPTEFFEWWNGPDNYYDD